MIAFCENTITNLSLSGLATNSGLLLGPTPILSSRVTPRHTVAQRVLILPGVLSVLSSVLLSSLSILCHLRFCDTLDRASQILRCFEALN